MNEKILDAVMDYMEENHISAYDETSGKGLVRHILIRYGFTSKEIMVCLVVNGTKLPKVERLIEKLERIPGMTSISLNVNREKTNVILGREVKTLWGQEYITDKIGNVSYQISPLSFYQVNPVQTKKLYEKALEYADLKEMRRSGICTAGLELFLCFWRRRRNRCMAWKSCRQRSRMLRKMPG